MDNQNAGRRLFLEGQEFPSQSQGYVVVRCHQGALYDRETGKLLKNLDTDADVEESWQEFTAAMEEMYQHLGV